MADKPTAHTSALHLTKEQHAVFADLIRSLVRLTPATRTNPARIGDGMLNTLIQHGKTLEPLLTET